MLLSCSATVSLYVCMACSCFYVVLVAVVLMVIGGVIAAFLYPRSVSVDILLLSDVTPQTNDTANSTCPVHFKSVFLPIQVSNPLCTLSWIHMGVMCCHGNMLVSCSSVVLHVCVTRQQAHYFVMVVCMYVWLCVCMYVYVYMSMCVCVYMCVQVIVNIKNGNFFPIAVHVMNSSLMYSGVQVGLYSNCSVVMVTSKSSKNVLCHTLYNYKLYPR